MNIENKIISGSLLPEALVAILSKKLGGGIDFTEFEGGFTPIRKFFGERQGEKKYFVKYAERSSNPLEARMTDFEAQFYDLIQETNRIKKLFPRIEFHESTTNYSLIVLEHVQANWGTVNSVEEVDELILGLEELSSPTLSDTLKTQLKDLDTTRNAFLLEHSSLIAVIAIFW